MYVGLCLRKKLVVHAFAISTAQPLVLFQICDSAEIRWNLSSPVIKIINGARHDTDMLY